MLKSVLGDVAAVLCGLRKRVNRRIILWGTVLLQHGLQVRQLLVGFETAKALACFKHAGGGPAQRHLRIWGAMPSHGVSNKLSHVKRKHWPLFQIRFLRNYVILRDGLAN